MQAVIPGWCDVRRVGPVRCRLFTFKARTTLLPRRGKVVVRGTNLQPEGIRTQDYVRGPHRWRCTATTF